MVPCLGWRISIYKIVAVAIKSEKSATIFQTIQQDINIHIYVQIDTYAYK